MNYVYERIVESYGVDFEVVEACGTMKKVILKCKKNNYRAFKYISGDEQLSDAKVDLSRAYLAEVNPPGALYA